MARAHKRTGYHGTFCGTSLERIKSQRNSQAILRQGLPQ